MSTQKHPDNIYLDIDPFEGDRDVDIRMQQIKIVTTRKEHMCISPEGREPHTIDVGSRAWRETAIVDNEFSSCYVCLDCLDKWINYLTDGS